jgi:TRAP transporter TAXI family solute receptor
VSNEHLTLTLGGTQSSSSAFAFLTAQSRLAADADGNMTINVRETGTSNENIQLLQEGAIDYGLAGLRTPSEASQGIGSFEGKPVPNLCTIMNFAKNAEYITVRADAGIESIYDLDGKAFAPGFQGTGLYDTLLSWFEILGIEVDTFTGSLEDVVNAFKDGRIVGFGKASAGFAPDASMLDVQSAISVKAIGFTQEDIDTIMAADPLNETRYRFEEVPAGTIYNNPEPFLTSVVTTNLFSSTDQLTEDEAYRLTRALWAAQEEAVAQTNYNGGKGITPEDTTSTASSLQICPGAQRYYDEVG